MTSLVDQLQLMDVIARHEAMQIALCIVVGFVSVYLPVVMFKAARAVLRRKGVVRSAIIGAISLASTLLIGKPSYIYNFAFFTDSGIYDCGSYVDFDTGEITAIWGFIPEASAYQFKWAYTYVDENDVTHGPYNLPPALVTARTATEYVDEIKTAKKVDISCYTVYVRPPAVHTNGVHDVSGGHSLTNNMGCVFPEIVIYANLDDGSSEPLTPTNAPPVPQSSILENLYQEINQ